MRLIRRVPQPLADIEDEGMLGMAEFLRILERERALADRHDRQFSLVEFDLAGEPADMPRARALSKILSARLRKTDVAGWINDRRIGVILADTPHEGGWKVAKDVCAMVAEKAAPVECDVSTYPKEVAPRDAGAGGPGSTAAPGQPTPSAQRREDAVPQTNAKASVSTGLSAMDADGVNRVDSLLAPPLSAWKRAIDVLIATAALIVVSPVMLAIGLLIKLVSPGPMFYRQPRVGRLGQKFMCWKFRTMHLNADTSIHKKHFTQLMTNDAPMIKLDHGEDNRIIPFGKFLRASAIDELPQLFNVLRGEMSIVGPRPCIQYEYDRYLPWQKRRSDTLPGLTGLWQVNGKNETSFLQMMRYDIAYAQRKSLWQDILILLRTAPAVLREIRKISRKREAA